LDCDIDKTLMTEPAYIRNFRSLLRTEPTRAHVDDIEQELYALGSDRATAVMFATIVENNLQRLILRRMRSDINSVDRSRLFDPDRPLGDFGAKIIISYALQFIGPVTKHDLDLIRLLRNGFAHSRIHFRFETPEVQAVCDHLELVNQFDIVVPRDYLRLVPSANVKEPRTRFICACHDISYRLSATTFSLQTGVARVGDPGDLLP
jgi:DNA-binding MltR family transcriptional regulator